jgi:prepilin-type N-terminal cleavage/methylation domain-containing protein
MRAHPPNARQSGFTLLEVLAALVLAGLILVSLNMAMAAVGKGVDRTRKSLGEQSEIAAAVDIFGRDVARIAKLRRGTSPTVFDGYLFEGSSSAIVYPLREGEGLTAPGLYLIRLSVIEDKGQRLLVRERAPLDMGKAEIGMPSWRDRVVLLAGDYDIAFAYRAPRSGVRDWSASWDATTAMPEQLRLTVTNRGTGRLRVPGYVQSLAIDTEINCTGTGEPPCLPTIAAKEKAQ